MLASDAHNPQFVGASNPDSALHVRFYVRPLKNEWKSKEEGRPIFEDKTFVEIHTPGNNLNILDIPARPDHFQRFPLQWAHFQNTQGKDAAAVGTPIEQWPGLSPSQIEMLKAQQFRTVEMIAFASDQQIMSVGMLAGMSPFSFRDKAKLYLEGAKGSADQNRLLDELAAERKAREEAEARHKAEMDELRALIAGKVPTPAVPAEEPAKELKAGTPEANEAMERSQLAMTYEAKFGKKPHGRMSIETLLAEIEAPVMERAAL